MSMVIISMTMVMILGMLSTNGTHSTSGMSSLTQESMRYRKHCVTFNEFIEGHGLDWRNLDALPMMG